MNTPHRAWMCPFSRGGFQMRLPLWEALSGSPSPDGANLHAQKLCRAPCVEGCLCTSGPPGPSGLHLLISAAAPAAACGGQVMGMGSCSQRWLSQNRSSSPALLRSQGWEHSLSSGPLFPNNFGKKLKQATCTGVYGYWVLKCLGQPHDFANWWYQMMCNPAFFFLFGTNQRMTCSFPSWHNLQ